MKPLRKRKRNHSRTKKSDPWAGLVTERNNPSSRALDCMNGEEIAALITREDLGAIRVVASASKKIAAAAKLFAKAVRAGGRAIYVGAGTSGRLGTLDAAELAPTFGMPRVGRRSAVGVMAGGNIALRRSVEGAEDDAFEGARAIGRQKCDKRDFVIGISASSLAPYVRGALESAKKRGASTALITMNSIPCPKYVDVLVSCVVGPEILAGSTRMKSGLATKAILHAISTTAMVLSGKVYGNRMVDMKPWCEKLRARGLRVISEITGAGDREVLDVYRRSGREIKTSIVMIEKRLGLLEARRLLANCGGDLRRALERKD